MLINTLVINAGSDPVTGREYPDLEPVLRTPKEIYNLLMSGFKLQYKMDDNTYIDLDLYSFYHTYSGNIEGDTRVSKPKYEKKPDKSDINIQNNNKKNNGGK